MSPRPPSIQPGVRKTEMYAPILAPRPKNLWSGAETALNKQMENDTIHLGSPLAPLVLEGERKASEPRCFSRMCPRAFTSLHSLNLGTERSFVPRISWVEMLMYVPPYSAKMTSGSEKGR